MVSSIYGASGYQQAGQVSALKAYESGKNRQEPQAVDRVADDQNRRSTEVKAWKPFAAGNSLIPTQKTGYGNVIGDVELSDKAREYYDKLKSKFHGADFILVSNDRKGQVAANAASYGNASKPVILIDEEKLERMATDDSFRKKYEGIIESSLPQLQSMKNSLSSSGAAVKNFGMAVGQDGKTSFFATLEKASEEQNKIQAKHQARRKAERIKERKNAEKHDREDRIDRQRRKNHPDEETQDETWMRGESEAQNRAFEQSEDFLENSREKLKEFIELHSDSVQELVRQASELAFGNTEAGILAEEESKIGGHIDFRG
ncbi:MAG: hypothetical protein J5518_06310 [Lachnospiraceae bacterium]|nr:hypothetical protein [Lachnospiraceae bacterium]